MNIFDRAFGRTPRSAEPNESNENKPAQGIPNDTLAASSPSCRQAPALRTARMTLHAC